VPDVELQATMLPKDAAGRAVARAGKIAQRMVSIRLMLLSAVNFPVEVDIAGKDDALERASNERGRDAKGGLQSHRYGHATPAPVVGIDGTVRSVRRALLAVLLNARGAQAGKAVLVDRILPGQKFFDGQRVTTARLFQRKEPAPDRRYDFCLSANDPAFGSRCRQIGDRQWGAVGPDDVLDPRAMGFGHSHSHTLDNAMECDPTRGRLKFG
jgi:hypothetical protein